MAFEFPDRGLVFWPVSNGDSTTIIIDAATILQVDLNHLQKAEEDDDPTWCVIDELVARLPKRNGRPYLAVFALTHPDLDHCRGFRQLLEEVWVGELWVSPRVFAEYKGDLSDDAAAFKDEAWRRVNATIAAGGDPGAGDRVRMFGYSDLLKISAFQGFPEDRLVVPGTELTVVDEVDVAGRFRAFVHSPFKDDIAGERNDTSLGMQVTLSDGDAHLRALLFGDLQYPTLKRIFDVSEPEDVEWNALLAPHHCSKSAMYWKDEADEAETLKQDILDALGAAASGTMDLVISSSDPVPASDTKGANPPHAKAKKRYEGITSAFVCTMEHPDEDEPQPVVVKLGDGKPKFAGKVTSGTSATAAAAAARGRQEAPGDAVTYG